MQDGVRFSFHHVGLLALAITASGLDCSQDGPFSDSEMDMLRTFALPAQVPNDTSNAVADLQMAADLGKKFFYDPRVAGALGPYNVAGANGALGAAGDSGKVACASCHD